MLVFLLFLEDFYHICYLAFFSKRTLVVVVLLLLLLVVVLVLVFLVVVVVVVYTPYKETIVVFVCDMCCQSADDRNAAW